MLDAAPHQPRQRVLVVDDDRLVRRAIALTLDGGGFEVLACERGDAAVKLVSAEKVHLMLLDVVMPHMSGLEVCRQVKAMPRGKSLPVVFLSGQGHSKDIVAGLDAGADGYIEKPIEPGVLLARVRSILRFSDSQKPISEARTPSLQDLLGHRLDELARTGGLSRREQEVLQLLLLGRTVADIGLVLGIAPRTAKFHQANILAKLGAESRFDLMRLLL